jgi:hypothetical protein
LRALFPFTSPV